MPSTTPAAPRRWSRRVRHSLWPLRPDRGAGRLSPSHRPERLPVRQSTTGATDGALVANATVGGRDATLSPPGPEGQAGADFEVADGSVGLVTSRQLTTGQLNEVLNGLRPRPDALSGFDSAGPTPVGLKMVDVAPLAARVSSARSDCVRSDGSLCRSPPSPAMPPPVTPPLSTSPPTRSVGTRVARPSPSTDIQAIRVSSLRWIPSVTPLPISGAPYSPPGLADRRITDHAARVG